MTAQVNRLLIPLFLLQFVFVETKAQQPISVDFYLNNKQIRVGKQVIQPTKNDIIKVKLVYPEKISVASISVKYYELVPEGVKSRVDPHNQQQSQTMGKYILSKGNEKEYKVNIKGTMNPTITIPVKDFFDEYLSKLRFKILDCTDVNGNKLHRNNKVYEFYLPILETMKEDGVVK